MLISGIQKFTLLDFPNTPSCIVFTLGCNFRCGYCHNPEFVRPESVCALRSSCISEAAFFNFLEERRGLLDGVVVSGGEPTIMPDLPQFLRKVKALGFRTKLDTNGSNPTVLGELLGEGLLDYVAMDIKTSIEKYRSLVGPTVRPEFIEQSVALIKESGVEYEFRSTLVKELHPPEVLHAMGRLVRGARRWYLQQFRPGHTLDERFADYHPFSAAELATICQEMVNYAHVIEPRGIDENYIKV